MKAELPDDFDPAEYLVLNPDVKKASVDPIAHYLTYGIIEKRIYKGAAPTLGIALIACDRFFHLSNLVKSIQKFTDTPYELIICNDSKSLTSKFIESELNIKVIGYQNQGVIRNKNRALYYFSEISPKDVIILIEDDVEIADFSWEKKWIMAASLYGQINVAPPWFYDQDHIKYLKGGGGTPENPSLFSVVTGQCTAVKKDLVKNIFGYFDSNFRGYGYGHVEWTNRFVRSNFGGRVIAGQYYYLALKDNFIYQPSDSFKNSGDLLKNNNYYKITGNRNGYVFPPSDISDDLYE